MVAALVVLLLSFVASQVLRPEGSVAAAPAVDEIQLFAPTEAAAGETIDIAVVAPVPNRTEVMLAVFGSLESTLLRGVMIEGKANFLLEPVLTDHAGRLEVVAEIGTTRATQSIQMRPGPAVEPVVPLVGPRTIIANTDDATMVVVSPVDRAGNPVANGTTVTTTVERPDGTREATEHATRGGVASMELASGPTTGRTRVTSTVGSAAGPTNVVDEVAGRPAPFAISLDQRSLLADGFRLHKVSTGELRDVFANQLPDGVSAVFVIDSDAGRSFLETTVQGGVASTFLEAPATPGEVVISARVSGQSSEELRVDFVPAVAEFPVFIDEQSARRTLMIGPVLLTTGGYPADGTTVIVRDIPTGDVVAQTALRTGLADIALVDDSIERVEVDLLGMTAIATIGENG